MLQIKEIKLPLIRLSTVLILISCASSSNAQAEGNLSTQTDTAIYEFATVMPEFPGGEAAMTKFIVDNLRLSEVEKYIPIQTSAYVEFIVETDGSVSNVKAARGSRGEPLTAEVIRVVQTFPKFSPARNGDKLVRTKMTIPVKIHPK